MFNAIEEWAIGYSMMKSREHWTGDVLGGKECDWVRGYCL